MKPNNKNKNQLQRCSELSSGMMEAVRTSETSVNNHFTRQYIPEDNSEHHTRHRENLKSHNFKDFGILVIKEVEENCALSLL
jgi:hypothetical protein